nr:MAG TPA: hypothetical protein [Bacteriophage sp.]
MGSPSHMSERIDCFFSGKNKGIPFLRPNMRKALQI